MFLHFKNRHVFILLAVVCLGFLLYWSLVRTGARPGGKVINRMTPFVGGTFEASGVAGVPESDGVLLVDNGRPGQVFWMSFDENGNQVGAVKAVSLGVGIEDIEGITTDGQYFYVVSSQSRPKAIATEGLVRFKFDARSQSIEEVASISGLKRFLVEQVAELREEGHRFGSAGGLNIEGLAWDPRQGRLLLGLRSPIVDGQALLVPLKLRNLQGAFSIENLEVEGSKAIRLPLGGLGIRGMEYDGRANAFKIISGAADDQKQNDFGLWEWNGDEKQIVVREVNKFDKTLKAEGVARATAGKRDFVIVVFDAGGYTIMD